MLEEPNLRHRPEFFFFYAEYVEIVATWLVAVPLALLQ